MRFFPRFSAIAAVTFAFFIGATIQSATLPPELSQGLVEWLDFDGNINDSSGIGINGIVSDATFSTNRFGLTNSALRFTGQNDQNVVVPDSADLRTGVMTASLWFQTGEVREQQLVFKGYFNSSNANPQWSLFVDTLQTSRTTLGFALRRNGVLYQVFCTNPVQLTNQWQFVAATWDGTNATIYLNGEVAGVNSSIPHGLVDPDPTPSPLVFAHANTVPYAFSGEMDDFKLYNRPLSRQEIRSLFQVSLASQAQGVAITAGGFVVGVTVTDPGYGYTNIPNVSFIGGGGSGAQASAFVTNGMVESIQIDNPGKGYTNTPSVIIDPPGTLLPHQPYPLPPRLALGLVEWLPLDGNVVDVSGNGNNGVVTNGVGTVDRFAEENSAIHFDGRSDQNGVINDSPSLRTPYMTTAFWFRTRDIREQQLFFKGYFNLSNLTPEWSVYVDTLQTPRTTLGFGIRRNGVLYTTFTSGSLILTNQWQFATCTWDGTSAVIYLDGKEAGRNNSIPPGPVDLDVSASPLVFGHANTVPFAFSGDLDDFKLYNRALSAAEVQLLYDLGNPPQAAALARIDHGFVVEVDISNPGFGYTTPPNVVLMGGGGSGATASAVVSNGVVTAILIDNPGKGYVSAPIVQIDPPPAALEPTYLSIAVKTVEISMQLNVGRTYVVESSTDMTTWVAAGPSFVATSPNTMQSFDVSPAPTFFRLRDITP